MLPVLGGALIRFYYGYQHVAHFLVTIAQGIHLFPFRTEKLSPAAPMVLPNRWESRSSPSPCEGLPSSAPLPEGGGAFCDFMAHATSCR